MRQIARNVTDVDAGFLSGCRFLIRDRDPLFTDAFRVLVESASVATIKLLARSPNLNAHAEPFVRSIQYECLRRMVPSGERHLREAVGEYTKHYHSERNHQGLDKRLIEKPRDAPDLNHAVECAERLGGILQYYYRNAA
ncbi:MAG: putative transposase [Gammaproteobacteria bacterium]|jgi:putative transposase